MKRIFALFLFLLSVSSFAFVPNFVTVNDFTHSSCRKAVSDDNPGFCPDFQFVADCHCVEKGLPKGWCKTHMRDLYDRMITTYGSITEACKQQDDVTVQECVDDWNCYINGGKDSKGRSCSATQKKCP